MDDQPSPASEDCVEVTVSLSLRVLRAGSHQTLVSRDDFMSRYRMTNSSREEVLREL